MQNIEIDLSHFRTLLEERRVEILKNLKMLDNDLKDLNQLEVIDDGDFASISSDSYKDNILASHQLEDLKEIDYSLKKIENEKDIFGICEMCQEEIMKERLEAKPFAIYCKICRDLAEKVEIKK